MAADRLWRGLTAPAFAALVVLSLLAPSVEAAPRRSPLDRVVIVTANVLEGFDSGDLRDMSEMKVFARRVLDVVPLRPDVLLLQEVNSKSAHYIASIFSRKTGDRYVVVTDAGKVAHRETATRIIKSDLAIVMNSKTMAKAGRSGYIVTRYRRAGAAKIEYKRNARALLAERGGSLRLALVSVHLPKGGVLSATKKLRRKLDAVYPSSSSAHFEILGGDFNKVGVTYGGSYGQLDTHAFWDHLVETHGYADSGYNVYEAKYVDYVFVRGGVWGAGFDKNYNPGAARGTAGFYSDHQFRWAVVGPDEIGPTTPSGVSIAARKDGGARMKLTWSRSTDNAGIAAYDIYRSTDNKTFRKVGTTSNTTYYDEKVSGGTRYWYRVFARDWSNNLSKPSVTLDERA